MPKAGKQNQTKLVKRLKLKIIAIPGKIKQIDEQVSIPLKEIPPNAIITDASNKGEFIMTLAPGKYTFFILKDKEAYRNSFDGNGFFTQTEIKRNTDNIVLIYDKFAFY
tara:strand:- start:1 stop:327 length:327 start_codon:yes stop_codon:yes gene_type:complete